MQKVGFRNGLLKLVEQVDSLEGRVVDLLEETCVVALEIGAEGYQCCCQCLLFLCCCCCVEVNKATGSVMFVRIVGD